MIQMMKIAAYRPLYNFLQQAHAFELQHCNRFSVYEGNRISSVGHYVYFDSVKVFLLQWYVQRWI